MTWTIPGYVADSIVGHGASGEVWRGRCTVDGEVVALKRLPVDDAESLRNAQAEAAVLASFDHPHILRMRELLISEGEAILVTDFAHGGSLAEVLAHRGRLSAGEVVTIVAPIAAALAHAHAEGVVHGDVSASNILFTAAGLPLLADLGVARIVGQADGGTRATPLYVDPLVARGGVSGPHSDVFSLAAVAWHALTGAPPWLGESVAESLWLAADGDLPPIATAVPTIPPGLAAALDRALQDDGLLRGSAAELAMDARHAVEPIPVDGWTARPAAARSRPRHSAVEAPVPPPGLRAALLPARRGAVEPAAAVESASAVAALPATSVSGRPPFRRAESPPLVSPSARTRSARPRERHDAGPAAGRARIAGRAQALLAPAGARRRWALTLLSTAAVLASVVAGGWWAQHDAGRASRADSADRRDQAVRPLAQTSVGAAPIPAPTVQPATAQPATVQPATAQPATAQPATAQPTAAGQPVNWLAELARADAVREHAYATGDPALLAQVYPPGGLLDRDRAQLAGQVPAGCSLVGAVTQYSALDVQTAGPQSAKVIVTAILAPARLTCAGAQKATTPPVGPVRLAVTLSRGPDAVWRIEDQRLAS